MSRLDADEGGHGVEEETERTYVEVYLLRDILEGDLDWSNLGMIFAALFKG